MLQNLSPAVKKILIVNVAIFLATAFGNTLNLSETFACFNPFLPHTEQILNPAFKPWQIVTYMFLHADLGHIFSNMLGLIFFGPILESFMGEQKFLKFYIICGIGSAIFYCLVNYLEMYNMDSSSVEFFMKAQARCIGASGAVMGILGAFAYLFPNLEMMMLFIPIPIKAKYMVALYALYDLFQGVRVLGGEAVGGVAHFAHIGGLLVGIILVRFFQYAKKY